MHNVPTFPEFRKIRSTDRNWYDAFYSQFDAYADLSFGNLGTWLNQQDDLEVSTLNDNVILRSTIGFMGPEQITTLFGSTKIDETLQTVLKQTSLEVVPEVVVKNINDTEPFVIEEDPGNHDYILDTSILSNLEGRRLARRRTEIRYFQKTYGEHMELACTKITRDEVMLSNLRKAVAEWPHIFDRNMDAEEEIPAFQYLFDNCEHADYWCYSFTYKGALSGFIIFQRVPQKEIVVLNHIKFKDEFKNAYFFAMHTLAKYLKDNNIPYINMEQDLGIEGLRRFKHKLKPVKVLKKYTIRLK